jgi:hypothetical protein
MTTTIHDILTEFREVAKSRLGLDNKPKKPRNN